MHSRTWGVENGIGAVLACRFDGLAVLASTISTSAVEMVKKHNLVKIFPLFPSRLILTAEVDCMDEETVARLKRVGVDGVNFATLNRRCESLVRTG